MYEKRYTKTYIKEVDVKTLANKRFWLGMLAVALAFSLTVVGCEEEADNNNNNNTNNNNTNNPLTGTVTVSSNVAVNTINGSETMTLTADTSGLNGNSLYYFYQWIRDGSNISSATSKTYDVTTADYGKTLKVKVTGSGYSGEQNGEFTVQSPTVCSVSVKYDSTSNSAGRKRVFFERPNGTSLGNTSASLGTTAETITLTSWTANKFKMRIDYTFGTTKYYFKKPSTTEEEFDLTSGTKSYTLTFDYNTSASGYYSNLVATEN